ncbi:MAG: mannose-1-phosphate guanylyltransferase/mannose-6-phosphate isomerase [Candidatus Gerdarchaeota archaeon]|nr:MAG: mannose-1-phosphate guanylyltransferase/mannose-6-phosphate isomerase [Candidatus Gerdarchaeota archaeon]
MKTLILASGYGERLFPLSREDRPKQFVKIDGESLLQKTVMRASLLSEQDDIYVITRTELESLVKQHLGEIGINARIILEPSARGTLITNYIGMSKIAEEGNSIVALLPSDHIIEANQTYIEAFKEAEELAKQGYLVVFGIKPTNPHTGYGYIKPGKKISSQGFLVKSFVEKPNKETAQLYINQGYLWNSGMLVTSTETFFRECKRFIPELNIETCSSLTGSFEKKVLEKSDHAAVMRLDVFWTDVGSFQTLYEISEKNKDENAVLGKAELLNAKGNLVVGDNLYLIDVNNLAVIKNGNAVLVCPLASSQKVRDLVKIIRETNPEVLSSKQRVEKPWGYYYVLYESEQYKVKELVINPKQRLSLQSHNYRSEHWIILEGYAKVTVDDNVSILKKDDSIYIPKKSKHRVENPYESTQLKILEIQTGEKLDETDIIRFEDDYGRT